MSKRQRRARLARRRKAARRVGAIGGVTAAATLLSGAVAEAANFTVTNTSDCAALNCGSLRDAITQATLYGNNPGGASTIVFQSGLSGSIDLSSDLPTITYGLTITGPGPSKLAINGEGHIVLDSELHAPLAVSGLAITRGARPTGDGGGVFSSGPLSLSDMAIYGNSAYTGGGVASYSTLAIENSTISGNSARYGGGIATGGFTPGNLSVSDSTITGNTTTQSGEGGGIFAGAALTVTGSTIVGNAATFFGGGIEDISSAASTRLQNSIVSGNTAVIRGPDLDLGAGGTASFSLIGSVSGSGITPDSTDIIGKNPELGPLQNNGGPTDTMRPAGNSPVIDQGQAFGEATDQRGLPRTVDLPVYANAPGGDGTDIGAVELQPSEVQSAVKPSPQVGRSHPILRGKKVNTGITVTCPSGGSSCTGGFTATAFFLHPAGHISHAARRKAKLVSGSIRLGAGQSETLTFKLSKKAREQLHSAGKLKITVEVVIADGNGAPETVDRTFTLKAKKGKH